MPIRNKYSLIALLVVITCLVLATFVYLPKWQGDGEKVISWDVAGYYQYLPALFIHKDLKKVAYLEDALATYRFTPDNQQTLDLPNGNRVMKYASGQAVMYFPFFIAAHTYAKNNDAYPADGFSIPYQLALEFEIIFFALLGIWFLRKILLRYFSDGIAAITIIGIGLGTNYFEYASMNGAMTHNNLFALYAILIYATIVFHEKKSWPAALAIGLCIGLAMLTRPTEIISALIPILWPVAGDASWKLKTKVAFVKDNWIKIVVAIFLAASIGFIQLLYWKYVSGDFLVYSYGNEGFDWLRPHIKKCLISVRAGWLVYSPMIGFALLGFRALYKQNKAIFFPCICISILAMYITFSWQTWWYGGSVGQRAMIQHYPLLALPFAALIKAVKDRKSLRILVATLFTLFVYHNFWITHQVHRGGLIYVEQMTTPYMAKILWRYDVPKAYEKLLDTPHFLENEPVRKETLVFEDFESGVNPACHLGTINGKQSYCLSSINQYSPAWSFDQKDIDAPWVRLSGTFLTEHKVWSPWQMGQMIVKFMKGNEVVQYSYLRYHRFVEPRRKDTVYLDVRVPKKPYDRMIAEFINGRKENIVILDDVRIEQLWED